MNYDIVIIGGGLSGLMAGIKLVKRGFSVAIVSAGQSALHFYSGSFGLLGNIDGEEVCNPLDAIERLPESHPYKKIGADAIPMLAEEAKILLSEAGLTFTGTHFKNHYRLSPFGMCEPAWLTLSDYAACDNLGETGWKNATIINFKGFPDFFPAFIADGMSKHRLKCNIEVIDIPEISSRLENFSDTRATTIARLLKGETLETLAGYINRVASTSDVVIIPGVLGLDSGKPMDLLRKMVTPQVMCVPTVPLTVCGVRSQNCLRRYFEKLGGTYFIDDKVLNGDFDGNILKAVSTVKLEDSPLEASKFILSTGSFFSQGLVSTPDSISEPVLDSDLTAIPPSDEWSRKNFFESQPFMKFGVETDKDFKIKIKGQQIDNVYAIGSLLGGADSVKEGSGGGIAILTALQVANSITR